jgi:hypothetical protein
MATPRRAFALGVLEHAVDLKMHLYAVGGYNGISSLDSVERYDYVSNTWTTVAKLPFQAMDHAVATLTEEDGKQWLYCVGGGVSSTYHRHVVKYEPTANGGLGDWTSVASMSTARRFLGAGVLTGPNGNQLLYAAGGRSSASAVLKSVERYDSSSDTWTSVSSMSQERRDLDLAVIERANGDRHLVAVGGYRDSLTQEATVEQYDAADDTWTSLTSLPLPRRHCAVASVNTSENASILFFC